MTLPKPILTPPRVASLTFALPLLYVLIIGPERFYYESWGTWIMSPVIYTRISPYPLNEWLLREFVHGYAVTWTSLAAPVLILFLAAVLALISIGKNSIPAALSSVALVAIVFTVYHFLQPLGMTYVQY